MKGLRFNKGGDPPSKSKNQVVTSVTEDDLARLMSGAEPGSVKFRMQKEWIRRNPKAAQSWYEKNREHIVAGNRVLPEVTFESTFLPSGALEPSGDAKPMIRHLSNKDEAQQHYQVRQKIDDAISSVSELTPVGDAVSIVKGYINNNPEEAAIGLMGFIPSGKAIRKGNDIVKGLYSLANKGNLGKNVSNGFNNLKSRFIDLYERYHPSTWGVYEPKNIKIAKKVLDEKIKRITETPEGYRRFVNHHLNYLLPEEEIDNLPDFTDLEKNQIKEEQRKLAEKIIEDKYKSVKIRSKASNDPAYYNSHTNQISLHRKIPNHLIRGITAHELQHLNQTPIDYIKDGVAKLRHTIPTIIDENLGKLELNPELKNILNSRNRYSSSEKANLTTSYNPSRYPYGKSREAAENIERALQDPLKAAAYFLHNVDERSPMLAELREWAVSKGLMSHEYEKVTPEKVKAIYEAYMKDTSKKRYPLRIFNIMDPSKESNFKLLADNLNELLATGVGTGVLVNQITSKPEKKEGVTFKRGGNIKYKGSGTKDACYYKVKSRYTVWPSAYASGALSKCRKVGASNWGNKSK